MVYYFPMKKFRSLLAAVLLALTVSFVSAVPSASANYAWNCSSATGTNWGAWDCTTIRTDLAGSGIYRARIQCTSDSVHFTTVYGPWRNINVWSQANCLIGYRYGPPSIERI